MARKFFLDGMSTRWIASALWCFTTGPSGLMVFQMVTTAQETQFFFGLQTVSTDLEQTKRLY